MTNENDIRTAAHSIFESVNIMGTRTLNPLDLNRSHSINVLTEEFLGGYMQDGRMSVVRRFFCLFVTFDLFFVSLLWLICILITGDNIYNALKIQVVHYSIYTSLFDVVMAAVCRFVVLILFYALMYINHWSVIALSTSGSCFFLISKVFVYNWVASPQPVFHVVLIITSFVLAWGEAWFLDCRVIPQERHANSYFNIISSGMPTDRSPLIAPFLASQSGAPQESIANFYSPYDTAGNSDEDDEQDEEYRNMGNECVNKAYDLLDLSDWKFIKLTNKGDNIWSTQRDRLGKIYRLTGLIKFSPKKLSKELFYNIEDFPRWNPSITESKIIRRIDSHTCITYQATTGGPGGIVKCRDFVNLSCWRLYENGKIILNSDDENDDDKEEEINDEGSVGNQSVSTVSDDDASVENVDEENVKKSSSFFHIQTNSDSSVFRSLSKSLGAKDFQPAIDNEPPSLPDSSDNENVTVKKSTKELNTKEKLYINAAVSIEYSAVPPNPKYIRGENLVSCMAMREIIGKPDSCIFEWLLCVDLKGYVPRYFQETAYTTLMQDYMKYLRKHCAELKRKRKKVPH